MTTDNTREAFLRLPYDKVKFLAEMLGHMGQKGDDLWTYAAKTSRTQLKKQATDEYNNRNIEDLTSELITDLIGRLESKNFETMRDAYKYSMSVMSKQIANEVIPLLSAATVPKNQIDIARSQGKVIESYRDKSGKIQYRPKTGPSGEWVDDTTYKLDLDHQAQFLGTQATPNDPRNDTDFDEWDGELVFNETDLDLNIPAHQQASDTVVGVVGLGAVASPMIGHNQPPEDERIEPEKEPEIDPENLTAIYTQAITSMKDTGVWEHLTDKERMYVCRVYKYTLAPEAETEGKNWPWYQAGYETGLSEDSARKIKSKIAKRSAPEQQKLNNLKRGES